MDRPGIPLNPDQGLESGSGPAPWDPSGNRACAARSRRRIYRRQPASRRERGPNRYPPSLANTSSRSDAPAGGKPGACCPQQARSDGGDGSPLVPTAITTDFGIGGRFRIGPTHRVAGQPNFTVGRPHISGHRVYVILFNTSTTSRLQLRPRNAAPVNFNDLDTLFIAEKMHRSEPEADHEIGFQISRWNALLDGMLNGMLQAGEVGASNIFPPLIARIGGGGVFFRRHDPDKGVFLVTGLLALLNEPDTAMLALADHPHAILVKALRDGGLLSFASETCGLNDLAKFLISPKIQIRLHELTEFKAGIGAKKGHSGRSRPSTDRFFRDGDTGKRHGSNRNPRTADPNTIDRDGLPTMECGYEPSIAIGPHDECHAVRESQPAGNIRVGNVH